LDITSQLNLYNFKYCLLLAVSQFEAIMLKSLPIMPFHSVPEFV